MDSTCKGQGDRSAMQLFACRMKKVKERGENERLNKKRRLNSAKCCLWFDPTDHLGELFHDSLNFSLFIFHPSISSLFFHPPILIALEVYLCLSYGCQQSPVKICRLKNQFLCSDFFIFFLQSTKERTLYNVNTFFSGTTRKLACWLQLLSLK